MKEVLIDFDNKSPASVNESINIAAFLSDDENVEYKFIEGLEGIWKPIQDFSESNICNWVPEKSGRYMIMVQGKSENCQKPYDYLGRVEYEVVENSRLIEDVKFNSNKLNIGEKLNIEVISNEKLLLYRFWIRGEKDWEPLRDYSIENNFTFTANEARSVEILIEAKRIDSKKSVDDFTTIKLEVKDLTKAEITNFICLSTNMLVNEELVFKVEANYEMNRPLLYKFLKVSKDGKTTCIQDFSSKSMVSFIESNEGEYKLLCLVRDMFSTSNYDDRAFISYTVSPYKKVKIKRFKGDLASPQVSGHTINLSALVEGGREILYRYIIEGPVSEDSGYIRGNKCVWEPKEPGQYKITLKAKDISYDGEYQAVSTINYEIYNKGEKPVRIVDIKCNRGKKCLINQPINIKVKVEGGRRILYKFVVYRNGAQREVSNYGKKNWFDFTPSEIGEYEIEIKVKDEFSVNGEDSTTSIFLEAKDYISADIDYILINSREYYIVGDIINIEAIMKNTNDTLIKFVTKINGREVESTDFINEKAMRITPKCPGKYSFVVYAKNIKSNQEYDVKKEVSVYVNEVMSVNSTKIDIDADINNINVGNHITFNVNSKGGKNVCYEFYIMINGEWVLVQQYSRKKYYTFLPFREGQYRILVLSKSYYKEVAYEDYDILEFKVK